MFVFFREYAYALLFKKQQKNSFFGCVTKKLLVVIAVCAGKHQWVII